MKYPKWKEIRKGTIANTYSFMNPRYFPMIAEDMPTFMGRPHAAKPEELAGADVVIIGAPYVSGWGSYMGVEAEEWLAAPKRIRQQSVRYGSGYVQELDLDVFEYVNVIDYGDADIPAECLVEPTAENVLRAQKAVEEKVNQVMEVGAIPVVIGQNSPCGSYAIAKVVSERTKGQVGCVSLDTHWDIAPLDKLTMDPRIAGSDSWKYKTYEFLENFDQKHLVEIGERGMLENKEMVREFLKKGTKFYPMWKIRTELGIDGLIKELRHAYENTEAVYCHWDMDILGGAGPAPGDILGELAEPYGMNDYEVIRLAHEVGKRGVSAFSFICIPPGSAVTYRVLVYVIMFLCAGLAIRKLEHN